MVMIFTKGFCTKVNAIAHLELELASCEFAIRHINHYAPRYFPLTYYIFLYQLLNCIYVNIFKHYCREIYLILFI